MSLWPPVTTYFSLFSPGLARYNIEIARPDSIAWENNASDNKDFVMEWLDRGGLQLNDLEFDMWSMRGFIAQEIAHFPGALELHLSVQGSAIKGEIMNSLDLQLSNCSIICRHMVSPPFEIRKGRNVINLALSAPLRTPFEMSRHFKNTYNFDFGDINIDKKREQLSVINNISSTYFSRKDFDSPVIYGWSDKNISEVRLQRYHYKSQNKTFFVVE